MDAVQTQENEGSNPVQDVKVVTDGEPQDAKDLFESLETPAQLAALGFSDKTFLAAVARIAATLSRETSDGGKPSTEGRLRKDSIDWESTIATQTICEVMNISRHVKDTSDEDESSTINISYDINKSLEKADASGVSEDMQPQATLAKMETASVNGEDSSPTEKEAGEEEPTEENEEFRIRDATNDESNENDEQLQNGSDEAEAPSSKVDTVDAASPVHESNSSVVGPLGTEEKQILLSFLSNICVIFPPTLASHDKEQGSPIFAEPLVTIHPNFLKTSGAKFLSVFNQLLLSNKPLKGHTSLSFEDSLVSMMEGSATLPFYALLLLRFQNSIVEALTPPSNFSHSSQAPSGVTAKEYPKEEGQPVAQDNDKSSEEEETGDISDENLSAKSSDDDATTDLPGGSKPDEHQTGTPRLVDFLSQFVANNHNDLVSLESLLSEYVSDIDNSDFEAWLGRYAIASTKPTHLIEERKENAEEGTTDEKAESASAPEQDKEAPAVVEESDDVAPTKGAGESTPEPTPEISDIDNDIDQLVQSIESTNSTSASAKKSVRRRKKKKKRRGANGNSGNAMDQTEQKQSSDSVEVVEENTTPVAVSEKEEPVSAAEEISNPVTQTKSEELRMGDVVVEEIAPTENPDADKSIGEDTEATRSDSTAEEQPQEKKTESDKKYSDDGLHISRVDGVGTVVVTPSLVNEADQGGSENQTESNQSQEKNDEGDHDEWETVEVRSRGNRKKADRGSQGRFGSQNSNNNNNQSKKKAPRNAESRKRNAKRKMVREILSSVLDAVDEQVRRRRQSTAEVRRPVTNAWGTMKNQPQPPGVTNLQQKQGENQKVGNAKSEDPSSIALQGQAASGTSTASAVAKQAPQRTLGDRLRQRTLMMTDASKKGREKARNVSAADQNTIPTLPETLSAVSTVSPIPGTRSSKKNSQNHAISTSESSSVDHAEETRQHSNAKKVEKEISPSPPLPTLLSPGNANSATSSVASSLDAPHGVHHTHHSYPGNENDVGYHLLHVCDRLTRDISQFMKRRDQALNVRRNERKLVLGALQETVSRIFPGLSSVEMYGSCATDLDLPSSDLDLVVCGLDKQEALPSPPSNPIAQGQQKDVQSNKAGKAAQNEGSPTKEGQQQIPPQRSPQQHGYQVMYGQMTPNAERVVRLAMDLERQPWAVHVKAIPTASVPVIKILADPARLSGAPTNGTDEWLLQHSMSQSPTANVATPSEGSESLYPGTQSQLPWRGADVVNGLLKVDITFEGPEHGGIGSTKLSSRVVKEFSDETGLPPDGTAAVQVLMVLKEVLAQRRLNEPFSGGLSSYALLLLVISVVRERAIIRQELERVEKQRRMVAAGGGNAVPRPVAKEIEESQAALRQSGAKEPMSLANMLKKQPEQPNSKGATRPPRSNAKGNEKGAEGRKQENGAKARPKQSTPAKDARATPANGSDDKTAKAKTSTLKKASPASSSWASIASKTNGTAKKEPSEPATAAAEKKTTPVVKRVSSFADAVAKGKPASQTTAQPVPTETAKEPATRSSEPKTANASKNPVDGKKAKATPQTKSSTSKEQVQPEKTGTQPKSNGRAESKSTSTVGASSSSKANGAVLSGDSGSLFPQGFHDVIEVLCSGETTPGKLLMHFLLFYGQHFDSHSTAIDYSGTHQRHPNANNGYSVASPYLQRRNNGSYDPMTGMLTVDPIVVYDPLEGAEKNNVARSCFAWSSIRWVFAQSYMTLSSAVEMSAGNNSNPKKRQGIEAPAKDSKRDQAEKVWNSPYSHDEAGNVIFDPSSPILELLLSF